RVVSRIVITHHQVVAGATVQNIVAAATNQNRAGQAGDRREAQGIITLATEQNSTTCTAGQRVIAVPTGKANRDLDGWVDKDSVVARAEAVQGPAAFVRDQFQLLDIVDMAIERSGSSLSGFCLIGSKIFVNAVLLDTERFLAIDTGGRVVVFVDEKDLDGI